VRAIFWGTPEFATPALRALIGEGHDVVGVVTQPDRPIGRHHSVPVSTPVKEVALAEGIPVLQPESARSPELLQDLKSLQPEISVVVAFGQILPATLINLPEFGTINVHASLLPSMRGAAPIQAAIRDGLESSGVTVMQMVEKLDAGPIILQIGTPIVPDETFGELQLRLSELGALALVQAMVLISMGKAERIAQDESQATYAPRITREDARIDWNARCAVVARAIRAYDPKPGAFSNLARSGKPTRAGDQNGGGGDGGGTSSVGSGAGGRGDEVRLFGARSVESRSGQPGLVIEVDESGMLVGCGQGCVRITYVHPAGRRRMAALDWMQGRGVEVGDVFGTSA
jgi:methionyl-tRNA formyltransferase